MACEIDFNSVTLSSGGTVDNLGENLASNDRFPPSALRSGGGEMGVADGCMLEEVIKGLFNSFFFTMAKEERG